MSQKCDEATVFSVIFADLSWIIIIVLLILVVISSILLKNNQADLKDTKVKLKSFEEKVQKLEEKPTVPATAKNEERKEQPPIIILSEAEGYTFKTGSAEISKDFQNSLKNEIIPKLEKLTLEYNCDIIEIIGHTDSQIVKRKESHYTGLDLNLGWYIQNHETSDGNLKIYSNSDLGLLRAWSVCNFLENEKTATRHLSNIKHCYAYSAAQAILPSGKLSFDINVDDPQRRRVEIRIRRSIKSAYQNPW